MPCKQMLLKHIPAVLDIFRSDIVWYKHFNLSILIHNILIFVIILLVKILDSGKA